MDSAPFGLLSRPFRPTLDTDAYCPLEGHEAALHLLRRGYASEAGVVTIVGMPGVGKTLVGLKFLESLPADSHKVWVQASPGFRPIEFFQAILFDLGKPYQGMTEQELRLAVTSELLADLSEGRTAALLIDEAHHLTGMVLEEIRLLGNLSTKTTAGLFTGLLGQPGLSDLLSDNRNHAFVQRLSGRSRIDPLNTEESLRYLRHQIRIAGGRPEMLFTEEALNLISSGAHGSPRMLNRLAALALTIAHTAGNEEVDAEAVGAAYDELGMSQPREMPSIVPVRGKTETPAKAARPPRRKSA